MSRLRLIETEKTLKPYFKILVEEAVYHQGLDVTNMSQFYLVNLLDEFAKINRLFDWRGDHYEETPLATLLCEALSSDLTARIKAFKKMGDVSLYVAGYFAEHVDKKIVDIDYYISMGEGAYKNLSGIFVGEKVFHRLYEELALKFVGLMGILSEVRYSGKIMSNRELVRLYEQWLKTGDPQIREKLKKEGIVHQK